MADGLTAAWEAAGGSQFRSRWRACLAAGGRARDRLALLIVDDDAEVVEELTAGLVGQPVDVHTSRDPACALLLVGRTCPDVVLLGPTTGRLDPLVFLTVIRQEDPSLPVLVGAGADSAEFAAGAGAAGATVIVPRPYRIADLLRLLRSFAPSPDDLALRPMPIDLGRLRLDGMMPRIWLDGREIPLPPMEFMLLRYMAERPDTVVTRTELTRAVWGEDTKARSNTLTVHVMRLRKRLGDDDHNPHWIKVVRGLGYRFTVPD